MDDLIAIDILINPDDAMLPGTRTRAPMAMVSSI
jgi:hypothetical protein